jgi:hypothetical protein
LDERPSLNPAHDGQDDSKNSDNARPSDHGPIKGIVTIGLIVFGAWLGVWSIVFWDRWGRWGKRWGVWRWIVSALGWAIMVLSIVQGLPIRP